MELSGTINRSITLSGSMIARGLDGRGIVSIAKTGTSGLVDTYTITYTDATTSTFTVTNGANGQITATSFAEEFSSSKAYAAGDYVVYSGQLYQFTTAHAAGAWNASHATAVQIADQVSELKSALEQAIDDFAVPTQEAVDNWLDAHPEATTTVQDDSITMAKLAQSTKNAIQFTRSIEETGGLQATVAAEQFGNFVGGRYTISNTINLTYYGDRLKTLSDCYFILESDMFTFDYAENAPLPIFTNCVFYGNNHSICVAGKYISQARFINCVFINCSLIKSGDYVQTANFIGCRFIGSEDIINAVGCGDITFDSCQGETDFQGAIVSVSGTGISIPIDSLRLTNCVFEGNTTKTLIVFPNSGYVYITGCYFENNTQGIVSATSTTQTLPDFIVSIKNTKIFNCGANALLIDSSYSNKASVGVIVDGCILGSYSAASLCNNENIARYVVTNCFGNNVSYTPTQYITSALYSFAEDSNSQISVTLQLQPGSTYLITQQRAVYTGFILYAVVINASGTIYTEKIHDPNNRWTVTTGSNNTIKIVSNAYGGCSVIKIE